MQFRKYSNETEAIHALTLRLADCMSGKPEGEVFNLALSGGETAKAIFRVWAREYAERIDWQRIHFYWVDERCVPPDSPDSNYRYANELLFVPLGIQPGNVHRLRGEDVPEAEAGRYEAELKKRHSAAGGSLLFDCILLGVGDDMHTASIFPGHVGMLTDRRLYAVAHHPLTRSPRITMTGRTILCGAPILVHVWGDSKAHVIAALDRLRRTGGRMPEHIALSSPISYVLSSAGDLADVFAAL